jgi:hypothetical protein
MQVAAVAVISALSSGMSCGLWWWNINTILCVSQEEKRECCKVKGTRWPSNITASPSPFPRKISVSDALPELRRKNAVALRLVGVACLWSHLLPQLV